MGTFGCLNPPPPPPGKTSWRRPCLICQCLRARTRYFEQVRVQRNKYLVMRQINARGDSSPQLSACVSYKSFKSANFLCKSNSTISDEKWVSRKTISPKKNQNKQKICGIVHASFLCDLTWKQTHARAFGKYIPTCQGLCRTDGQCVSARHTDRLR